MSLLTFAQYVERNLKKELLNNGYSFTPAPNVDHSFPCIEPLIADLVSAFIPHNNSLPLPRQTRSRYACPEPNRVFGDSLRRLKPGTPVYCKLACVAEHTGICLGDTIVHLDGNGDVVCCSPREFLERLDGNNPAFNVYYAAIGENKPLGSPKIAARAKALIDTHPGYDLQSKNCHGFCISCINGRESASSLELSAVEAAITQTFNTQNWQWRNWEGWKLGYKMTVNL